MRRNKGALHAVHGSARLLERFYTYNKMMAFTATVNFDEDLLLIGVERDLFVLLSNRYTNQTYSQRGPNNKGKYFKIRVCVLDVEHTLGSVDSQLSFAEVFREMHFTIHSIIADLLQWKVAGLSNYDSGRFRIMDFDATSNKHGIYPGVC